MNCLQVVHKRAFKEVCNFYALSSSLFILWKPYSKSQPCPASLPNFRQKKNSWIQSQDRGAKQTHQMSCFLDMLLNLSQLQGYPKEKGVAFISCLNEASFVLLYGNVCLLWILFSLPERENRVRLWAYTTVGCSGLSWPRPAGRGTSEILSWTHPKWSIRVPTWDSESLEPESSSSRLRYFVLDINIFDFMILLPHGHVKHVEITVRTMKSEGRFFLFFWKLF